MSQATTPSALRFTLQQTARSIKPKYVYLETKVAERFPPMHRPPDTFCGGDDGLKSVGEIGPSGFGVRLEAPFWKGTRRGQEGRRGHRGAPCYPGTPADRLVIEDFGMNSNVLRGFRIVWQSAPSAARPGTCAPG